MSNNDHAVDIADSLRSAQSVQYRIWNTILGCAAKYPGFGGMRVAARVLLEILNDVRNCVTPDDRNRIYALHPLLLQEENYCQVRNWLPELSYAISAQELYTRFAVTCLDNCGPDILEYAGTGYQTQPSLASWVPDWTDMRNGVTLRDMNLATDCQSSVLTNGISRVAKHGQERILVLGGFILDTISEVSGVVPSDILEEHRFKSSSRYWEARWKCELQCLQIGRSYNSSRYPSEPQIVEALWQTIVGDSEHTSINGPPKDLDTFHQMQCDRMDLGRYPATMSMPFDQYEPSKNQYQFDMVQYEAKMSKKGTFFHYQVCLTNTGYFGLVPEGAKKADRICIVSGRNMPLVLSPEGRIHKLVGPCWINGFNPRQAVEDYIRAFGLEHWTKSLNQSPIWAPMPAGWSVIFRLIRLFYHPGSLTFTINDPRRALICSITKICPEGWIKWNFDGDDYFTNPEFFNPETTLLPTYYEQWSTDYGILHSLQDTSEATFDDPRFPDSLLDRPLPEGWHSEQRPYLLFHRDKSKVLVFKDPRLSEEYFEPLPSGWRHSFDLVYGLSIFKHSKENISTFEDPRQAPYVTGPVPAGWIAGRNLPSFAEDGRETAGDVIFTNLETGEQTTQDPCLPDPDTGIVPDFPGFLVK